MRVIMQMDEVGRLSHAYQCTWRIRLMARGNMKLMHRYGRGCHDTPNTDATRRIMRSTCL
ncbi:hypothetical protein BIFGAL_02848 [Bifidobacterium gallicum DSM 20093 = LMG 11596]|uniref:Uncharacterized protein n=1 Tax=Bifidobacterium gallicum DSM 20093 = LMG 11596 TaxID=561180 RepID=D1NST7_9BIFI|nr:hypothetical protein BIFGAL_02848 [Bifidobacterium gallicum DSM 20093 = LMG 11596]